MDSFLKKQLLKATLLILLATSLSGAFGSWKMAYATYSISILSTSPVTFSSVSAITPVTFTATTTDPQGVVWSVDGAPGGSLSVTNGLTTVFTAPSSSGHYTLNAKTKSDLSAAAHATVIVNPFSVSVTPQIVVVGHNESVTFSANTNDPAGVTWSVVGNGAINSSGVYTSSSVNGVYDIWADSVSDDNSWGHARVCVANTSTSTCNVVLITASTQPSTVPGSPITLTSATTDPLGVSWLLKGDGNINTNTGVYTPPSSADSYPVTDSVTLISNTDGDVGDEIDVTVWPVPAVIATNPISVSVSPSASESSPLHLDAGQKQQFTATVANSNQGVVWSVDWGVPGVFWCANFCRSPGSIDQNGLYTASIDIGADRIVATSLEDPSKFAASWVNVSEGIDVSKLQIPTGGGGGLNSFVVSPASTTIEVGSSVNFKATVNGSDADTKWLVQGGASNGAISQLGVYTAPLVPGVYHVVAVAYAYGLSTDVTINVIAKPVLITVSPASVSLLSNTTKQFSATVQNATNTAVIWSVSGTGGGSISSGGLYTAPSVVATSTYYVLVKSVADPTKIATSTVTVLPLPLATPIENVPTPISVGGSSVTTSASSTASSTASTTVAKTPTAISSIIDQVAGGASAAAKQINNAANATVSAIQTPAGSTVVNTVSTVGAVAGVSSWTLTSLLASPIFASPIVASEILFVPFRLWGLVLSALGLRRRNRPWGTVYDSVTKMPIDPAVVTLYDEAGKKVATSITDLDGRFGFMVPKGVYRIKVQKTNYAFPSKKLGQRTSDELYSNLYFGEKIEVTEDGSVIYENIPMDPQRFDWNEFTKNKMGVMRFHSLGERSNAKISNAIFWFGFAIAIVSVFVIPHIYSITILSFYVVLIALRFFGVHRKPSGIITDSTNHPLSFAVISVFSKDLRRELFKKVADQYGHYYILVPKGEYEIKVLRKNADESYTEVYDKDVTAKEGVINQAIKV